MMFRDKSISKLYAFALAAVFALTLAGCGGGGGSAQMPEPGPMPDPQMECEDAGGRYNADGTCTSAEELVMEMQAAQRSAISTAIMAASTAVGAVDNDSTDAEVSAADTAIANARSAITAAANLSAEEKAANTGTVDVLAAQLAGAKTARMAAMDEADMAERMAMMATAMKLHTGINAPGGTGEDTRTATYAADDIAVTIGTAAAVNLSEDEDTTVAANHGWEGMRFTASPDGGGTYEAVVYSDVGDPTEGAKFSDTHTLNADTGETGDVSTLTGHATSRVASPSFDQSAGTKTFELPDNAVRVMIAGSYQGVSGMYYCTPTGGGTDCSAAVASSGFTLAGGVWTFKPTNPDTRLMGMADANFASYGWWLHTAENGALTASAFTSNKGTAPTALAISALRGTATYMGGAAGKYALYSATGGTNDAGHFTARATLNATFGETHTITGTIDNFMGADGQSRNWSVALNKSTVSSTGDIAGDPETVGNTDPQMTVWAIDGTAADAAGQWSGALQDAGDDGVPSIGTGTFHSMYSTSGQMVGAFGARK